MVSNELDCTKCMGASTGLAQTPATKTMPADLKMVWDEAVRTINAIKSLLGQLRLFGILQGDGKRPFAASPAH